MRSILGPGRTILFILFFLMITVPALAEIIILEVFLNQQDRGEYFVQLIDGQVYLRTDDARQLGLPEIDKVTPRSIEGEDYVAVGLLHVVSYRYDELSLTLHLEIASRDLPEHVINLSPERHSDTYFPQDDSFFFNYGAALGALDSFTPDNIDATGEVGFRHGRGLLLTDMIYSKTPEKNTFARLQSRLVIDDRQRLRRWVYGDFQSEPTPYGSSVALGGVSLSRKFRIDPYYIYYPAIGYTGTLATPGEIEVYLDGFRVHREELPPGRFVLNDLTRYGGAGELSIVVRDIFGHEERITRPFYLDEKLLNRGEHEYSYNLGLLREDYGVESFSYGDMVLNAFHRYGWRKNLTAELSGEGGRGLLMLTPRLLYIWDARGLFDLSLAGSVGSAKNGFAMGFSYGYRNRKIATSVRLKLYSKNFSNIVSEDHRERPATEAGARFTYGDVDFGSLSFELATVRQHIGDDRDLVALSYNRRLSDKFSLYVSLRHTRQVVDDTRLMVTLSYRPRTRPRMAFRTEVFSGGDSESVQWYRDPPEGEGYGYRVESERRSSETGTDHRLEHSWQYNARYGIGKATAEIVKGEDDTRLNHHLSVAGGIACVGGRCEPTRPVRDSFAVVKVGDVSDVRVMNNGQVIGRTDDEGIVFIPNLTSFYGNQLAIDDQDIPLERSISTIQQYVSPSYRSGSCVFFPAARFQPLTGRLYGLDQDGEHPLEFVPIIATVNGQTVQIGTGRGGEFYLDPTEHRAPESIPSGGCDAFIVAPKDAQVKAYQAVVGYNGKEYPFTLDVPESDDFYLDLGKIVVNVTGEPQP